MESEYKIPGRDGFMNIYDFSFDTNIPIYLQISKMFESKLFVGELESGDVIPSRRELAADLKVNLNTVQKAYSYMEDIGLIKTEKNRHSIITYDENVIESLKEEFLKEPLETFILTMKSVNISKKKVIELIDREYDKIGNKEEENKEENRGENID